MTNPSRGELVPGGLAMVIGGSNVGVIVHLICKTVPGGRYVGPDGLGYRLRDDTLEGFMVQGEGFSSEVTGSDFGFKASKNLMPIDPEPDPLEITQHQEQSA